MTTEEVSDTLAVISTSDDMAERMMLCTKMAVHIKTLTMRIADLEAQIKTMVPYMAKAL